MKINFKKKKKKSFLKKYYKTSILLNFIILNDFFFLNNKYRNEKELLTFTETFTFQPFLILELIMIIIFIIIKNYY